MIKIEDINLIEKYCNQNPEHYRHILNGLAPPCPSLLAKFSGGDLPKKNYYFNSLHSPSILAVIESGCIQIEGDISSIDTSSLDELISSLHISGIYQIG